MLQVTAPLHIEFDEKKACQAAAQFILLGNSGPVEKLKLAKLIYLLDRESLARHGRPVVGGAYVSMAHGPVTSELLDSMNFGAEADHGQWHECFEPSGGHGIALTMDPGEDELSERESRIIAEIHVRHGAMTTAEIRDFSQNLPEWEGPCDTGIEIPLVRILKAAGRSDAEAETILKEIESRQVLIRACRA